MSRDGNWKSISVGKGGREPRWRNSLARWGRIPGLASGVDSYLSDPGRKLTSFEEVRDRVLTARKAHDSIEWKFKACAEMSGHPGEYLDQYWTFLDFDGRLEPIESTLRRLASGQDDLARAKAVNEAVCQYDQLRFEDKISRELDHQVATCNSAMQSPAARGAQPVADGLQGKPYDWKKEYIRYEEGQGEPESGSESGSAR